MAANTNPKTKPEDTAPAPEEKKAVPTGKMILIVEDEKPLAHALEMKLKNEGYATKTCMNGSDALEEIKKADYALMLLDLIMPVIDGFAVLEGMQTAKVKTPVIVLSNLGQEEDRAKAKTLGAIDYFVKSNTPLAEIIKRVKSAL
jgi:DNA-binding response OmpR family regulator